MVSLIKDLAIAWLACGLFVDNVPAPAAGATWGERIQNFFLRLSGPIGVIRTVVVRIKKLVAKK
ncbi:MAG: hypothetical protein EPN37_07280 [Chitinophagaceae bacterium]|nr:MAG: hypothetical protein EPN37_07280 [Chitinophagaceae bacterium]